MGVSLRPKTLVGRVFALFSLGMLFFTAASLGAFYHFQYLQHIEETQDAANTLVEVASRAVEDSALIGDYDTVKRTLSTLMLRSPFRTASFIDLGGGTIQIDAAPDDLPATAPQWLRARIGDELYDVNRVVAVGGRDYGVLRLSFDEGKLASQLWLLVLHSAGLAAVALGIVLSTARVLLARWLKNLGNLRFYDAEGANIGANAALAGDTPLEIREAIEAIDRSAASMRDKYGQRIAALMNSLVQYKSALDQAAIVCEVDRDGRVLAVNEQFVRHSCQPREQLVGRPLAQAGGGWSPSNAVWSGEVGIPCVNGERQWYRTIVPIFDAGASVEKYICIDFDISERKQFEAEIVRNAMRQGLIARLGRKALEAGPLTELFELATNLACGGIGVPHAALVTFAPGTGMAGLGAAAGFPSDAEGTRFACAPGPAASACLADWGAELLGAGRAGSSIDADIVCNARPFGALTVYDGPQRTFQEDEAGFLNSLANILSTAIEREDARNRLTWMAQFDNLTGLPNRHRLSTCLEEAIEAAGAGSTRAGVMFIDLDRFKSVNDMLGHSAGDELLAQAGRRLLDCVRSADVVARLGGDEFAVVLPQLASTADAEQIAQRIVAALAEPFMLQGQQLFMSASVGIAAWPDDGIDAATLLKSADTAMYSAKQNGRNNFQFYLAEMNANAALRLQTEHQLHLALERGEFELHYQPRIDLRSMVMVGMEALIRWNHPQRGMVSPAQFIPIAEETGLIAPIGRWVLHEACMQTRRLMTQFEREICVSVNVSARQLAHATFVDEVRQTLAESGIPPHCLELELTESALIADIERTALMLQELHALGVKLAVDDFGTGYSGLTYLRRFPIDVLKLDRSFMVGDDERISAFDFIKAFVDMAHALNLAVVAEGVETLDVVEFLRSAACDQAQGYHFSRPLPLAALREWLALASPPAP